MCCAVIMLLVQLARVLCFSMSLTAGRLHVKLAYLTKVSQQFVVSLAARCLLSPTATNLANSDIKLDPTNVQTKPFSSRLSSLSWHLYGEELHAMADLMENDGIEDEAFPPFPPPHSPGQGGPEGRDSLANGEEEGELSKLAEVPVAKRKGVRRPQPKLDSQRLISERGLPALRTLFDNVHFRGKGHEAENLRLLMQKMENWAHRLYPKLQFEDFIDKVEKLGNKKEVQTCLKRIRLDMPLTHEDFMDKDGDEEAALEMQVFGDPDPFSGTSFPSDLDGLVHSTPAPAAPSLTEEQCRRMELNRQRALERRLARQQQTGPSDSQTVDAPTSVSSTNTLNGSNTQDENVEGLDKEPGGSSTQQLHNNLAHKDSEPSAESSLGEEEKEYNPSPDHQPSSRCEGGD